MSHRDYQILRELENHPGYKYLQVLQLQKMTDIESRRDVAASRGQEQAWRYFAGQEKGAKSIMVTLTEELLRLEKEGAEMGPQPSEVVEKLMNYAREEAK